MWIRIDTSLCDHPKVIALAAALKLDKDAVVGKLLRLWAWASQNRENGILRAYDAETIAEIMRVKTSPQKLLDALCAPPDGYEHGFIDRAPDGTCALHAWQEYTGKSVEDRNRNTLRMREARAKNVRSTCGAQDEQSSVTETPIEVDLCEECATHKSSTCEECATQNSNMCGECARATYTVHNNPPIVPPGDGDECAENGAAQSTYPAAFERFWNAYPRKTGKGKALDAWKKLKKGAGLLPAMLKALEWQRESDQWQRDGGQYIPYPATWLNQRRWEDDPPAPQGWDDGIEGKMRL